MFKSKSLLLAAMLAVAGTSTAAEFTVDGIKYNVTDSVAKTVEVIANNYQYDITIPETVTPDTITWTVTAIGQSAFSEDNVYTVSMPNTVKEIKDYAFYRSKLISITLSDSLQSIGISAFYSCDMLHEIELPEMLNTIGEFAFDSSGLVKLTMPNSVQAIGECAFQDCKSLETVTLSNQLRVIPSVCFEDCSSLKSITIPESVVEIESRAFCRTSLTHVKIPDNVTTIKSSTFDGCKQLEQVIFPKYLNSIGEMAFKNCDKLTFLSLPNNLIGISSSVFSGCHNVRAIYIPEKVTSIGGSAFAYQDSLREVHVRHITPLEFTKNPFSESPIDSLTTLYVPSGTIEAYKAANIWNTFANIVEEEPSISLDNKRVVVTGTSTQLDVTMVPSIMPLQDVTWSSADESIATVDNNGIVTGISEGTTTVTAKTTVNENTISASCQVTVINTPVNYFTVEDATGYNNITVSIPVLMTNEAAITAFQCDIYLPDGMNISTVEDDYDFTFSGRETRTHIISAEKQADGAIRVAAFSSKNSVFSGNEGALFNMPVCISTSVGNYTIAIKNIIMVDDSNNEIIAPEVNSIITVKSFITGDANIDGKVTISDATVTVSHILGETPENFLLQAADVSGDGEITINDVTGIIDIVLGATSTAATVATTSVKSASITPMDNENDCIYINDFTITAGETKEIEICMSNSAYYTAFQCDIYLPDGLNFYEEDGEYIVDLSDRKSRSHTIATNLQDDGSLRVVAFSSKNANFSGNDGALMILPVVADETIGNNLEISVKNNLFVSDNIEYVFPDVTAKINDSSSIDNIQASKSMTIFVQGHSLHILSDKDCRMELYSIDGRYTLLDIRQGHNTFNIANNGLYIINGEKVVIK